MSGWRLLIKGYFAALRLIVLRSWLLADPGAILDAVDNESHNGSGCSQLIERDRQIAEELGAVAPDKVRD